MIKQITLLILMGVFFTHSMKSDRIHSLDFLAKNKVVRCSKAEDGFLEIKSAYDDALSGIKIVFPEEDKLSKEYPKISLVSCGLDRPPIVRLSSLESFWCIGNDTLENPPVFIGLTTLHELNLYDNNLKVGPIDRQLPQIESLCLGRNSIEEFEFTSETLTDLDLIGNQLEKLGECPLPQLRLLSLSENKFEDPPSVCLFTNLTSLNLCSNKLSKAPDVRDLSKLVKLFLGYNSLQEFPKVPASLIELALQGNCIKHVPEDLIYPAALWLHVGGNYLPVEDFEKLLALGLKSVKGKNQKKIKPDH